MKRRAFIGLIGACGAWAATLHAQQPNRVRTIGVLQGIAIYPFRNFAVSGGLISYGINAADQFRQAAPYVDRILRGTKPDELPVQAPNKFELVINLKTAKTLGLQVSQAMLARADEVIE
jgi:ABC-type uncharacterized transport system substrate-binding protein